MGEIRSYHTLSDCESDKYPSDANIVGKFCAFQLLLP